MTRWYPDAAVARRTAIARDVATLAAVLALAWLGVRVHDSIDHLAALGHGVVAASSAVQTGFAAAGTAAAGLPLIGATLGRALAQAGASAAGGVAAAASSGEQSAHRLALVVGLLAGLGSSAVLLALVVPARLREIRRLQDARQAVAADDQGTRLRLLAHRAVAEAPYRVLRRHTADPVGDLRAERYAGLAAAALEHAGLDPQAPTTRAATAAL